MRPVTRKPKVTAGLKWPPEMWPTAETMTAIARPCAKAIPTIAPVAFPSAMIDPAPAKMSVNAPTNSAAARRRTSNSTGSSVDIASDGLNEGSRGRRRAPTLKSGVSTAERCLHDCGTAQAEAAELSHREPERSPRGGIRRKQFVCSAFASCDRTADALTCRAAVGEVEQKSTQVTEDEETRGGDERDDRGTRGVGDRVAGILAAAEEAAAEIRADAQRDADRARAKANQEAEARIQELVRDPQRDRDEAENYARDIRLAVEAYASKHRQQAEEEARGLISEAERRAEALRQAAQEVSDEIEEAALRRQEMLREEARKLEERRRTALEGLRDIAASIGDLLSDAGDRREAETLPEALEGRRRRLGR